MPRFHGQERNYFVLLMFLISSLHFFMPSLSGSLIKLSSRESHWIFFSRETTVLMLYRIYYACKYIVHCSKLGTALTASLTFFTVVIYLRKKSNTYLLCSFKNVQLYKYISDLCIDVSFVKSVIHDHPCSKHSMAGANLNRIKKVLTFITTSKYISKRLRICINSNPPFQTQIYLVKRPRNVNFVQQDLPNKKQFLKIL